jgi:tetratricopeptide (TPR) repeat protein
MPDTLQTAISHHQAGRLNQAEALYRQILNQEPRHPDALHLLGVIAQQRGRPAQAIEMIERAVALNPGQAIYHVNLGEAYRSAGKPAQTEAQCRTALKLAPTNAQAHYNLALALIQLGRPAEAVGHFEAAIEQAPFLPGPYAQLGNLLREEGKYHEALAIMREGHRLLPQAPEVLTTLGRLVLQGGLTEEALAHCQEALRLRPEYGEGLCNLALVLRKLNRREDAWNALRRAAALEPQLALAYHIMGLFAQEEGRPGDAVRLYEQALPLNPRAHTLLADLGAALYEEERTEEAIARYREALALRPDAPEVHSNLGYVLQDQGDTAGAVAEYREAIRLRPIYADALLNLGLALTEAGDMPEAITSYRAALRQDPNHPEAFAALALALRDKMPENELAAAESLLTSGKAAGKRRAVLQYGLAQVYDARGDTARVVAGVQEANNFFWEEDRSKNRAYDAVDHGDYVNQILAAYTPEHFKKVRKWGIETDVPIFIVGLPRSGTSLLEQVLASHPKVFGAGELNLARDCYRAMPKLTGKDAPGIACVGDLSRPVVQTLARRYMDGIRKLHPTAPRILDKMPDNYIMLGLIATMLPKARVIHIRRDLRDIALSCWMTYFRHIRWSFRVEDIGSRVRDYLRLMDHWREVLPLPMIEVDYEELVADLEGVARKALTFCELDWDPACLAFYQTRRAVRTASMTQVREPLYKRSLNRWKRYRDVLAPLEKFLPPEAQSD